MTKLTTQSVVTVLGLIVVLIGLALWWSGGLENSTSGAQSQAAAAAAADLSTAVDFAVLAGTAITNTGPSVITGDVGLSPDAGSNITGLTTGEVSGTIYAVDATGPAGAGGNNPTLVNGAKTALTAAYLDVAAQTPVSTIATELGGTTKFAGIYDSAAGTFGITALSGTLTLDAQGDPNAVFIFKMASTLTAEVGSEIVLANGAQACNVFWQVGSSATLKTSAVFKGNILALTSISLQAGANVSGRLLARNGAVTLISNTVTVPPCTVASAAVAQTPAASKEGRITVVKTVVNDNGGTKTIADFPLFVNGTPVVSGETNYFLAPADAYWATETSDANYTRTFSGDCDSNGSMGLHPGDNYFCVITNNDIGAPVTTPPVPPLIDVVKVPSPLALPAGPGLVNYTYTLRNIGTVPVTDITMVGDTCSPIALVSGDTNSDSKLDVNETWVHRCATTLSATHTNTVVATGWANGVSAVDIASATVVVGVPIVPPLIHVTKVPSAFSLRAGGGMVTYTKKITNPGTVALSNVRLTDDICSPVTYVSGDTNADSKLDATETWVYTCRMNLTKTTTNTVIAEGDANGLTARDFAVATVVVSAPGLPNAGLPPHEQDTQF